LTTSLLSSALHGGGFLGLIRNIGPGMDSCHKLFSNLSDFLEAGETACECDIFAESL